jgi:hypothetical protein
MTKQDAWDYIVKRNPDFLTTGAHLAPAGLKTFFETAYKVGYSNGQDEALQVKSNATHELPDFLKGIMK